MPTKKKKYNSRFPPARIKKIMQSDEEVGKVAAAVPVIISRALELFVETLLKKVGDVTNDRGARTVTPSHLKMSIHSEARFNFLKDLVQDIPDLQGDRDEQPLSTVVMPLPMPSSSSTSTIHRKRQRHPGKAAAISQDTSLKDYEENPSESENNGTDSESRFIIACSSPSCSSTASSDSDGGGRMEEDGKKPIPSFTTEKEVVLTTRNVMSSTSSNGNDPLSISNLLCDKKNQTTNNHQIVVMSTTNGSVGGDLDEDYDNI